MTDSFADVVSEHVRHVRMVHFSIVLVCAIGFVALYLSFQDPRLVNAKRQLEALTGLFDAGTEETDSGPGIVQREESGDFPAWFVAILSFFRKEFEVPEGSSPQDWRYFLEDRSVEMLSGRAEDGEGGTSSRTDQEQGGLRIAKQRTVVGWITRNAPGRAVGESDRIEAFADQVGYLRFEHLFDLLADFLRFELRHRGVVVSNPDSFLPREFCTTVLPGRAPRTWAHLRSFWAQMGNLKAAAIDHDVFFNHASIAISIALPSRGLPEKRATVLYEGKMEEALPDAEAVAMQAMVPQAVLPLKACIVKREDLQKQMPALAMLPAVGSLDRDDDLLLFTGERTLGDLVGGDELELQTDRVANVSVRFLVIPRLRETRRHDARKIMAEWINGDRGSSSDFQMAFRDLFLVLKDHRLADLSEIMEMLDKQQILLPPRKEDQISFWGIQLHGALVVVLGPFLILGIQVYFLLHVRKLLRLFAELHYRQTPLDPLQVPWLGVYGNVTATLITIATAAVLPAILVFYFWYKVHPSRTFEWVFMAETAAAALSIVVMFLTVHALVRLYLDRRGLV